MATEKVSVTLERDLVAQLRAVADKSGMSRIANEALADWLRSHNVDETSDEAGTDRVSDEADLNPSP